MAKTAHRTIVYVDGFNLYYGAIRGTPWKWLDLAALFSKVLGPRNELVKIKYFTARVRPSASDPESEIRQGVYLRAVQAHCPMVEWMLRNSQLPDPIPGTKLRKPLRW